MRITQNTGNASLSASFADPTQPTTGDYTLSYNGTTYTLTDKSTGNVVGSATNPEPADRRRAVLDHRHDERRRLVHGPADARRAEQLRDRHHDASAIAAAAPVLARPPRSNTGTGTITQGTGRPATACRPRPTTLT